MTMTRKSRFAVPAALAAVAAAALTVPASPAQAAGGCWGPTNWSYTAVSAGCSGREVPTRLVIRCSRFGSSWYVYGTRHAAWTSWGERMSCGSFPTALTGAYIANW